MEQIIPMRQNATLKKTMLQALVKSLGIVTTAAQQAGIDRATHYRWIESDPKYRAAVDDIQNVVLDFAESQLHLLVKERDTAATIFLLKTKGKKRGYIEKQEIGFTDTEGNNVAIVFNPAKDCEPLKPKE